MDRMVSKGVYKIPLRVAPGGAVGATARIRVTTYADGDAVFSAAPGPGELDEPPAINAIAALRGYLGGANAPVRVLTRRYEFEDDHGYRTSEVADGLVVTGGIRRVNELLNAIHRHAIAPLVG